MRLTVLTNTTLLYSITHFIYANSVVKRPGTSVPRRYKKKWKRHGTTFFSSTGGTEDPVNPVLDVYGPMISTTQETWTKSQNPVIKSYSLTRNVT